MKEIGKIFVNSFLVLLSYISLGKFSTNNVMNPFIKMYMDLDIRSGLSNLKITEKLKDMYKILKDLIPNNGQITNRRFYLKKIIIGESGELKNNTKGSFAKWREENNVAFESGFLFTTIVISTIDQEISDTGIW